MAKLTTEERNRLPASDFAGPNRTYPINDAAHAKAAIAMSHGARSGEPASPAVQHSVEAMAHRKYPAMFRRMNREKGMGGKNGFGGPPA